MAEQHRKKKKVEINEVGNRKTVDSINLIPSLKKYGTICLKWLKQWILLCIFYHNKKNKINKALAD